jgi:hypothetical protein
VVLKIPFTLFADAIIHMLGSKGKKNVFFHTIEIRVKVSMQNPWGMAY